MFEEEEFRDKDVPGPASKGCVALCHLLPHIGIACRAWTRLYMVGAAEFSSVLAELGMSQHCDRERMFEDIGKSARR